MTRRCVAILSAALAVPMLTGCSVISTTAAPSATTGFSISGKVHGGQQAIAGAHIYVFAANNSHYSTLTQYGSTSLLHAGSNTFSDGSNYYVTTDSNGAFNITVDYGCSGGDQVYIEALGGYSDGNPAHANSATNLMATLGDCPNNGDFSTNGFIWVNEVTTVATAYAIAGFAADGSHIGAPTAFIATNPQALRGIRNAFANAANLVNPATGVAPSTISTSTQNIAVPQTTINTLANILAACVNTTSSSSSQCSTLFKNATTDGIATSTTGGATNPTDTAAAILNIAHNPGANISTLFGLQSGVASPFSPKLATAPGSFTLALSIDAGLSNPGSFAIDANGNVWLPNGNTNSLIKVSPLGAVLSGSGYTGAGVDAPIAAAVDTGGDVWVANYHGNSISKFNNSGVYSSSGGTGLSGPECIAVDAGNNIWVGSFTTGAISKFNSSFSLLYSLTTAGTSQPFSIATTPDGSAWATSYNGNDLGKISSFGTPLSPTSGFTGGGLTEPKSVAIDSDGNAWVANSTSGYTRISKFTPSGSPVGTGYSGGGVNGASSIAIDGSGNVWSVSPFTPALSEFTSAGTAITSSAGYTAPSIGLPAFLAIDSSGDIWLLDQNSSGLTEFIGLATPVVTPLAANLVPPYSAAASKP